ncbi:MAG: hypothetical protein WCS94_15410, partial [Verrucomicrobiota bacterium]
TAIGALITRAVAFITGAEHKALSIPFTPLIPSHFQTRNRPKISGTAAGVELSFLCHNLSLNPSGKWASDSVQTRSLTT